MKKASGKSLLCQNCTEDIRLMLMLLKSNRVQPLVLGYMTWLGIKSLIRYKTRYLSKKVSEMRLFFLQKFHFLYILYNVQNKKGDFRYEEGAIIIAKERRNK